MHKSVGELLRLKRLEKELTLENVATKVRVSINYISKLEKGENSNPSDDVIIRLAMCLDLDEDELFHAFGKIPLATREFLSIHPDISKIISKIQSDEKISEEKKEKWLKKTIYWYEKISEED